MKIEILFSPWTSLKLVGGTRIAEYMVRVYSCIFSDLHKDDVNLSNRIYLWRCFHSVHSPYFLVLVVLDRMRTGCVRVHWNKNVREHASWWSVRVAVNYTLSFLQRRNHHIPTPCFFFLASPHAHVRGQVREHVIYLTELVINDQLWITSDNHM
jgi:hypothetical protein